MQTQVLPTEATETACLEFHRVGGHGFQRVPVDAVPFVIGRDGDVNLTIDSSQVSREHAAIVRERDRYRVEDLGSTNGTYVNGHRVESAPLEDGDILMVADIELSFSCASPGGARAMATQVLAPPEADLEEPTLSEIVRDLRRLQEAVIHGDFEILFQPIVSLDGGGTFGYEAVHEQRESQSTESAASAKARPLLRAECPLRARWRQLRRMAAVEAAGELAGGLRIFVPLDLTEIGTAGLPAALGRLRNSLAGSGQLVVEVPHDAESDGSALLEFGHRLQDLGIELACEGISSRDESLGRGGGVRPRFVKLAPSLTRGALRGRQRQRQIRAIGRAWREAGCQIIAVAVRNEEEAAVCRQLGCDFAQGPRYGIPQPADAFAAGGSPARRT
jgi:EAL domain-containing protein (putative c-di-GMP-specific phosphodiesterase class I)